MGYESKSRPVRAKKGPSEPNLREARLTIPDALVLWALDTERQIAWPRPYGQDIAGLIQAAQDSPLMPDALERLLSRLDGVVSAALKEGRQDLLVGFDLQTAEWLGLHYLLETPRGQLHIGPDPRTRAFESSNEPPWTYSEVRAVFDAGEREAVELAWAAKELLLEAFPSSRIASIEFDAPEPVCAACRKPGGSVMMATEGGYEYHTKCWLDLTTPSPRIDKKAKSR